MQEKNIRLLGIGAASLGVELSDIKTAKLAAFCDKVLDGNRLFNLTAICDEVDFVNKHLIDSLSAVPYLKACKLIDIGAGAGFPSMPIAIAREDIDVTALDSTLKKMNFLNGAAMELGVANLTAISKRAEEAEEMFGTFDIATARAVAPLNILLEIASPLLKVGGAFIAYKTSESEVDLTKQAIKVLNLRYEGCKRYVLPDGSERVLLCFVKTGATPNGYPRKYSAIKKRPL